MPILQMRIRAETILIIRIPVHIRIHSRSHIQMNDMDNNSSSSSSSSSSKNSNSNSNSNSNNNKEDKVHRAIQTIQTRTHPHDNTIHAAPTIRRRHRRETALPIRADRLLPSPTTITSAAVPTAS